MAVTITIEKHPLKDFTPSKYCEWCVTVETDDPAGWEGPTQWALDFPADTDILDPEEARRIKGTPKYTVDPKPDEGTITQPGATQFKICFVAACKERDGATDMSLESRINFPRGASLAPREWQRVPFEGAPDGVGKIVGPAALAMSLPAAKNEIGLLADFEARKIAWLAGVAARPVEASPQTALAMSSLKIFVSGATTAPGKTKQAVAKRRARG